MCKQPVKRKGVGYILTDKTKEGGKNTFFDHNCFKQKWDCLVKNYCKSKTLTIISEGIYVEETTKPTSRRKRCKHVHPVFIQKVMVFIPEISNITVSSRKLFFNMTF